MKEQISAFLDGECDELERARVLKSFESDPSLVNTWERYHLISAAMRRELDMIAAPGLSERIRNQLENVVPDSRTGRLLSSRPVRYAAGLAIAASVATVAVLNLSPGLVAGTAVAVSGNKLGGQAPQLVANRGLPPEKQRVLNPYLVHHAEFSSALSVNTMSAYARVVGQQSVSPESNNAE